MSFGRLHARIDGVLHQFVLHNDQIQKSTDLCLAPGQVGLLSGWGVFSTLRIADGVPFAWDRHWARLQRDAAALHVALPHDSEQVRRKMLELVEANQAPNCTLRIAIVRNGGGMWAGPSNGRASDLIGLTADSKDWGDGVKLAYVREARHAACQFTGTKILSWAMNLTWLESAQARGFDEVILLNERGEVAECTSANLFIANGSHVYYAAAQFRLPAGDYARSPARRDPRSGNSGGREGAAAGRPGGGRRGVHHFDHARSAAGISDRR